MCLIGVAPSLIRWSVAGILAFAVPAVAQAGYCGVGAISGRFVEAARLCDVRERAVATPAAEPMTTEPAAAPESAQRSQSVSVSMPGYQRRLAVAARSVRASGAPPTGPLIVAVARRYRISPHLLAAMVDAESRGHARAVSNKGALGLMQVMPGTARQLGVSDPRAMLTDPVLAMTTGAAYLKRLQGQLGNNVPLVVAAYNAGPGAVIKAGRRVPRYRETQGYVRKVVGGWAAGSLARPR